MTNSVTNLANGGVGGVDGGLFPSPSAVSADGGGGGNNAATRRSKSLRRGEMEGAGAGGGRGRAPPPLSFRDKRFT